MTANTFVRFFAPDQRQHGVRPVQTWGLRLFYLLMLVFVAPTAWGVLLSHEGPWDPVRAVTFAVWATYPALALFGLLHPLRWLPLMFFTIGYKAIWLAFVALPLWQSGTLWGTPTGEIAGSFLALPLLAAVVPWGYAWRTYVRWPRRPVEARPLSAGAAG
ncbi:hypothetical protein [Cognatiluteimonas profundi]|uniref:hypothetical protein n=1 Tax=Cognatiluteimonas profundi TaxID=2594501 RepID=UPI00131BB9F1|nr:hypothetical protein [Lysobacter profundi]